MYIKPIRTALVIFNTKLLRMTNLQLVFNISTHANMRSALVLLSLAATVICSDIMINIDFDNYEEYNFSLEVDSSNKIIDVKLEVQEQKKLAVGDQIMTFNDEQLKDENTLDYYKIGNGSTITIHML